LSCVERIERQRGGFDIEDEAGHEEGRKETKRPGLETAILKARLSSWPGFRKSYFFFLAAFFFLAGTSITSHPG
jgi:hypothetical protein